MELAFVFPGQGSQSVGMLNDLDSHYTQVKDTFAKASEVLQKDLWEIVSNGPSEALNKTQITQPAMLAAGVAVWEIWKQQGGPAPKMMAGHSLGEYTALVCAGALTFTDAISLVSERGRLMQDAVPEGAGAMAAILGLADDQVHSVCQEAQQSEVVQAVNFNAPGQVVIAGNIDAVHRAIEKAKEVGAKRALSLPVSVPSHCMLMESAASKLGEYLSQVEIHAPNIPVLHNFDVQSHQDPDRVRAALVKQLYNPVRWVDTINRLAQEGIDRIIECGPGKVLVGLNKRIVKTMTGFPVYDQATLLAALNP